MVHKEEEDLEVEDTEEEEEEPEDAVEEALEEVLDAEEAALWSEDAAELEPAAAGHIVVPSIISL
ncbi:hypothetical protein A2881_02905 [Candidatus Peribacteria bacterium RIFCSPHIGHO2_01_FULL_55_13]|nr:MAG: hypothetical protein A2881_02905 [Candidatus Peribacteria bacterium RIFCSPHIGHO2_01_FULL_55_13]OGJ65143.1 MAG: hypothetical protein A3F36_02355 [Candidatus Peribacteria bacterium RIFCSPHIGHO2_12_FULL_55_11]